jgi:hypothetical protein
MRSGDPDVIKVGLVQEHGIGHCLIHEDIRETPKARAKTFGVDVNDERILELTGGSD